MSNVLTPELKKHIEDTFIARMKHQEIKCKTKRFYVAQCEFFCGAATALQLEPMPPSWYIPIIASREIVTY